MSTLKHKLLFTFICLQLLGSLLLAAAFFVERWQLELLVSFTPQLMVLLFASLIISSVVLVLLKDFKRNHIPIVAAGTTWLVALFIFSHSLTIQKSVDIVQSSNTTITFATFNKLYSNQDTERFTNYLKEQDIDILALQEMRPVEVPEIAEQLGFEYTYTSRTFATSGGTSVVLLSRFPFTSVETIELATKHPVIRAQIETPDSGDVVVYSVHIPVPSSPFLYNKRNIVLDSLSETTQKEELPVIIGGDFNGTIFSPAMKHFSNDVSSTLQPIAIQRIPECSWFGYGSAMCIRIDHIFAPKSAQITNFWVAPDLGADHRALIAEIDLE